MEHSSTSQETLARRFRNRAIDCLELIESDAVDANEMINMWDDWRGAVLGPPPASSLSQDELEALLAFDHSWNEIISSTPNPVPPVSFPTS